VFFELDSCSHVCVALPLYSHHRCYTLLKVFEWPCPVLSEYMLEPALVSCAVACLVIVWSFASSGRSPAQLHCSSCAPCPTFECPAYPPVHCGSLVCARDPSVTNSTIIELRGGVGDGPGITGALCLAAFVGGWFAHKRCTPIVLGRPFPDPSAPPLPIEGVVSTGKGLDGRGSTSFGRSTSWRP
jgi:hypothetical protein